MIDHVAAQLALRNRALSVVVCTTGSMSLAAIATGYTRSSGSFITDGFAIGMEVTPAGFATNTPRIVTRVEALTLTVSSAVTAEGAAGGRTLSVGLPAIRTWENLHTHDGTTELATPIAGRPYLEEEYVPGTTEQITSPFDGGRVAETGLYVLRWYGLSNTGISAIRKSTNALKALFAPGTNFVAGADVVRVRGDTGPWAGQITQTTDGWAVCTLTIPWTARTRNTVAA